jgi:uncharacterized protein
MQRRAEATVREGLAERRVVLVIGPRQCGKSTLNRVISSTIPGAVERRLDDVATLERAEADPTAFVRHNGLLVIDEIQRAPDLLLAIKQEVDLNQAPGRFLLTGSANVFAMANTRESLAGRVEVVELHPFSQGEIESAPEGLISRLLAPAFSPDGIEATENLAGYLHRAFRGGFPEARALSNRGRARFFASYLQTLLQRDARDISRIRDPMQLDTMLRVLVDRHSMPFAVESAARDAALPRSTFEDHLALLQRLFLVRFLPAFATSATKRALKQRKLLIVDSGLAAWLAGWSEDSAAPSTGQAIEGFALQELVRQASWLDPRIRLSHYRSKDGAEVDLVIEAPDRSVVGVEVKSSETPRARDFRHLQHLRATLGPRFRCGVLLHVGDTVASYGDDMWAIPLSAVWTAHPKPMGESF